MRARAEFEKSLPPLTDIEQLPFRLKAMEQAEKEEWDYRAQKLEKLQKIQRVAMKQERRRIEDYEAKLNSKRVQMVWKNRKRWLNKEKQSIQRGLAREMRKLSIRFQKRKSMFGQKKDIVKDLKNPSSSLYTPLMRNGVIKSKIPEKLEPHILQSFQGLEQIEAEITDKFFNSPIIVPVRSKTGDSQGFVRREFRHEHILQRVQEELHEKSKPKKSLILAICLRKSQNTKSDRQLRKISNPMMPKRTTVSKSN